MRKRSLARDYALKILYQADITQRKIETATQLFWATDDENVDSEVKAFTNQLLSGIETNLESIDQQISKYAANWQLKRMAVIDRNILRLGVYELLFAIDIPPKVTINEAVELAKRYGDFESSKFVNGILDKIHKTESLPDGKVEREIS